LTVNKKNKYKSFSLILSILILFTVFLGLDAKADVSYNADLVSITINGQKINVVYPWVTNYNLDLPANTPDDLLAVVGEPYDLNSIVSVEGNRLTNKNALVKIIVTAENKTTTRTYYVNVALKEPSLNGSFIDIKTADFHSLALRSDGTLYAFGENDFGQLGDGSRYTRTGPVQVKGLANVVDFDTSNSHSAAVTADGSVWVWGLNDYGQLHTGGSSEVLAPIRVSELKDIVKVRTGNRYSIALDKGGNVWFWGYNSKGQVEDEAEGTPMKPEIVNELRGAEIKDIEAGDFHSLALSLEGNVYVWGANDFGQLGDSTLTNRYSPIKINTPSSVKFINAKGNTSICITETDKVFFWGESSYPAARKISIPEEVQNISNSYIVEANNNNIVQLTKYGNVSAYGSNKYGQLGNGSYSDRSYFSSMFSGNKAKKIATSPYNMFILGEDGCIYSVGRNEIGQLGIGTTGQSNTSLQKASDISDSQVERVYANQTSGEVYVNTSIRLATSTLSSKIYYTLDGSDPTERNILYEKPISVTNYTIIKAVAVKDGKYSAVSTFQYNVKNAQLSEIEVSIGSRTATSGSLIEVPITFSKVPEGGISKLSFAVQVNPEVFQLSTVTAGELIKDTKDFTYSVSNGTITLNFTDSTKTTNNITKTGIFATLKLYLKSSSNIGRYSISQTLISGEGFYSKASGRYNVKYIDGYIDTSFQYGDVDGDLKVTALDLQYVQRFVANKLYSFPGSRGREAADMNKDGVINSQDVELIKTRILKEE
jgi:alpha-tubulin suppressor-like RCC1 family protein